MSYQMEPVFVCAICGATASSPCSVPSIGWRLLPHNWVGSTRKNGDCYCEKCAAAIASLRDEEKTE